MDWYQREQKTLQNGTSEWGKIRLKKEHGCYQENNFQGLAQTVPFDEQCFLMSQLKELMTQED